MITSTQEFVQDYTLFEGRKNAMHYDELDDGTYIYYPKTGSIGYGLSAVQKTNLGFWENVYWAIACVPIIIFLLVLKYSLKLPDDMADYSTKLLTYTGVASVLGVGLALVVRKNMRGLILGNITRTYPPRDPHVDEALKVYWNYRGTKVPGFGIWIGCILLGGLCLFISSAPKISLLAAIGFGLSGLAIIFIPVLLFWRYRHAVGTYERFCTAHGY